MKSFGVLRTTARLPLTRAMRPTMNGQAALSPGVPNAPRVSSMSNCGGPCPTRPPWSIALQLSNYTFATAATNSSGGAVADPSATADAAASPGKRSGDATGDKGDSTAASGKGAEQTAATIGTDTSGSDTAAKDAAAPLWPDCDTVADIIAEETYGRDGEEAMQLAKDAEEYTKLARRALMWGTVWAMLGTAALCYAAMKYFGITRGVAEVLEYIGGKNDRDIVALQKKYGEENVKVVTLDISDPTALATQLDAIMQQITDLAEQQANENALNSGHAAGGGGTGTGPIVGGHEDKGSALSYLKRKVDSLMTPYRKAPSGES